MFRKNSIFARFLITGFVSAIAIGVYHKAYVSRHCVDKSDLSKLSDSIEPVIWSVIKQNPEAFFKVMNEAAQVQQERIKDDLEKSATQAKDKLLGSGIRLGLSDQANVQFVAFIDMMCPVSHEFLKVAFRVMQEKKDVSFRFIPLVVNGMNSEVMARFVLSANMQKSGNMMSFLENFSDKISHMTRPKLLEIAKQAGFDASLIEKGESDKKVEEELAEYLKTAESLKVQGTPSVYVLHRDGKMTIVPPMDVSGFLELAQNIRLEKADVLPASTEPEPVQPQKVEPSILAAEPKAGEVKDAPVNTQPTLAAAPKAEVSEQKQAPVVATKPAQVDVALQANTPVTAPKVEAPAQQQAPVVVTKPVQDMGPTSAAAAPTVAPKATQPSIFSKPAAKPVQTNAVPVEAHKSEAPVQSGPLVISSAPKQAEVKKGTALQGNAAQAPAVLSAHPAAAVRQNG